MGLFTDLMNLMPAPSADEIASRNQQSQSFPGGVPTPRPDERRWSQFVPRIQEAREPADTPQAWREVIPPSLLLDLLGQYPTSRKNGDAIDYEAWQFPSALNYKYRDI